MMKKTAVSKTALDSGNYLKDLQRWYESYKYHINRRYAKNTKLLYSKAIELFIDYSLSIEDEMDSLRDIRSTTFDRYIDFLEDRAQSRGVKQKRDGRYLSKATKDAYIKAIKGFFTYISDNNDELYTFDRYFRNIKRMNNEKPEEKIKHLSEDEITKLLNTLNEEKDKKQSYNAYRNSLLVKLMLFGGLRISEALAIRLQDFVENEENGMYLMTIFGKGEKEQTGYIAIDIIKEEMEYFKNIAGIADNELIMKTKNKKPLNRRNALSIVNGIYKRAGVKKQGLHILRHTLAMRLTEQDTNPLVIKKMLRHSNLATTTMYAKASNNSVADAIKTLKGATK